MYFRCPACDKDTLFDPEELKDDPFVECHPCQRRFEIEIQPELANTDRLHGVAVGRAHALDIEHATAVSLVLGIISQEQLRPTEEPALSPPPVALDARRRPWWPISIALVSLVSLAAATWLTLRLVDRSTPPADVAKPRPAALPAVAITRDEAGEVVQVAGTDARSVLLGYCESAPEPDKCEPLEILILREGRVGIFRDPTGGELHAIRIDRLAGRAQAWTAGDGSGPIVRIAAPDYPSGTPTIPVPSD